MKHIQDMDFLAFLNTSSVSKVSLRVKLKCRPNIKLNYYYEAYSVILKRKLTMIKTKDIFSESQGHFVMTCMCSGLPVMKMTTRPNVCMLSRTYKPCR